MSARGLDDERARLVAKVGVACVQAAYETWREDERLSLGDRIDAAFAALAALT